MRARLVVSLVALALAAPALAQKTRVTVDEMWKVQRVGTPEVSPDGKRVAFTVSVYDAEEDKSNADVWVVPAAGGTARRLTANKASDSSPVWSPDGTRLAFVSKRDADKAAQIYVMPVDGGEAERVTDMPIGVSDPRWLPDGKGIVFVSHVIAGKESPEDTKKALEAREKNKVKARVTENRLYRFWDRWLTDDEFPHLFTVDLASRKVVDLLPGSKRLFGLQSGSGSFDVSPDGKWIAFSAQAEAEPYRTLNYDVFLLPVSGGAPRNLTADNPADDSSPVFSPDGKAIAYGRESKADGWPDYARIALLDPVTGASKTLTEGWDNAASDWVWTPDGKGLVFLAEVRARTSIYALPAAGGVPREVWKGGRAAGVDVVDGGRLVFQGQNLSKPAELATVGMDGKGMRWLTTVNDALVAGWEMGSVEEHVFPGAGGENVQMFVVYPPGAAPGRLPLVQVIHGGPVGTFGDEFHYRWNAHAFAAPGYLVALVNFHGSSSFGQSWVESILGAHPDKPFEDVMKATDYLIARGLADPDRMAAAGGSYGGFLVEWIAGHTNRFKCLVSHAGVYDLLAQSASDTTFGRHNSYGGYPYTNLDNVEKWSPNRFAKNFETPMLVLHGERDYRVPVTQGLEIYGVLTAKGVPARLVYYPDENHWILKGQNAKHWYGEVLGWLAKYLK
jgi:dipeptidyl aminopeptidase/acylaminoacyl peptidase